MTFSRDPSPPEAGDALLAWYRAKARDLPWRRTRDPWEIWVSEIMLQQTRVEVVISYFERFVRTFPDPSALARADEETALALWSGLGYYTRCRNLKRGAALVVERHGGTFPKTKEEALAIPGVGPYTAAAILSIAYGLPLPVVDGNVTRVLSRIHTLEPNESRSRRTLEGLASRLLMPRAAGDFNQAMMELGATVCLPRSPRCEACPLASHCRARRIGATSAHPAPRPGRAAVDVRGTLYVARDPSGRLLLERGAFALLPHLWLPPIRIGAEPSGGSIGTLRHAITHHRIRLEIRRGAPPTDGPACETCWVRDAEVFRIGRSSLVKKALLLEARADRP